MIKGNFPISLLAYRVISTSSALKNSFLTPEGENEGKKKKKTTTQFAAIQYQTEFIDT